MQVPLQGPPGEMEGRMEARVDEDDPAAIHMEAMHILVEEHVEESAGEKGTRSSEFREKDQDQRGVHEEAREAAAPEENHLRLCLGDH